MSRSGYVECMDDILAFGRYRAQVRSAIKGKRGQAFLRELAAAMDAMPEKVLIQGYLIDPAGDCCTIGVVCKQRGLDVSGVDPEVPAQVAVLIGVARQLAAEIEFENDEGGPNGETPENRWLRMRRWVESELEGAQNA